MELFTLLVPDGDSILTDQQYIRLVAGTKVFKGLFFLGIARHTAGIRWTTEHLCAALGFKVTFKAKIRVKRPWQYPDHTLPAAIFEIGIDSLVEF